VTYSTRTELSVLGRQSTLDVDIDTLGTVDTTATRSASERRLGHKLGHKPPIKACIASVELV